MARHRPIADIDRSVDDVLLHVGAVTMGVTRIVANSKAPDPIALANFYKEVFELGDGGLGGHFNLMT